MVQSASRVKPAQEKSDGFKPLKATFAKYRMFTGRTQKRLQSLGGGAIIKRFEMTPYPKKKTDVVCPHFMELKWGYGCPYDCAWCFLKGTLRMLPDKTAPKTKERAKIEKHVRSALIHNKYPEVFNTGELCDSLMDERGNSPFSQWIIDIFQEQDTHKVLFLTKSAYVKRLLEIPDHSQALVSFSLNADSVAKRWEKAPSPTARMNAAAKLADAGWDVRVRIDPIVPVPNWRRAYGSLIDRMFTLFTPDRITLGTPRGLQSTLNNVTDKSWLEYLDDKQSGWGKKVSDAKREELYRWFFDKLEDHISLDKVGLCKETLAMFDVLGRNFKKQVCNCIL